MRKAALFVVAIGIALLELVVGHPALRTLAHHNGPWLPGDVIEGPVQVRAMDRGYFTFCFNANALNYPNARSQALEVIQYAEWASGLASVEVPWGPDCDIRNEFVSDSDFPCGSGAFACVTYRAPVVRIWYRRQAGFTNLRSAFCHEGAGGNTGHVAWLHEQYNDISFTSNGNHGTCMDFGTGVWRVTPWDIDRIYNAFVPDRPRSVWLEVYDGWATVRWDEFRADGGAAHLHGIPANTNARYMSFGWAPTPDAPVIWAGEFCGPEYGFCFTRFNDWGRGFDAFWHGCLFVRAENALTWFVPQVSAPNYWTLAGCWGPGYTLASTFATYFGGEGGDATCISWYESRFDPWAVGGLGERGLFQIHPIHINELSHLGYTWDSMFDPHVNSLFAAHLQRREGWRPWSTAGVCYT